VSVIENALKRLQASRGGGAAARQTAFDGVSAPGAMRRRENDTDTEAEVPGPARTIAINQDALRAAGLLPPPHQERELAQQYRQIKRPLINRALGRGVEALPHGNLMMIASAMPGEGKTFMSLNLALSMRLEEDVTVLLVDGDVVNPRVSQVLGAQTEFGLLDIIKDPSLSVSSLIMPTDVPGLTFLPAGRADDNATELLASARMQQVMTESQALAQIAGQILIVVRADQTPQHMVLEAIDTIAEEKPISLVLNQSVRGPPGYYYQYGNTAGPREKSSGA
jgi:Mrp family chromosome partitioning ATPase